MIIKKASYEIIKEQDPIKKIERIARVCYKSEDKIGEGTDVKMVKGLINRQHTAMLEHGSAAFLVDADIFNELRRGVFQMLANRKSDDPIKADHRNYLRFSDFNIDDHTKRFVVSGNFRAWMQSLNEFAENQNWIPKQIYDQLCTLMKGTYEIKTMPQVLNNYRATLIKDISELSLQERIIHEDLSVMFSVDRGVTHEMVRMREASFAQESTRYVNYSNGKYGSEITVIAPCFWDEDSVAYNAWKVACEQAEKNYMSLMEIDGVQAQQARDVLPQSTKAEITMTANLGEWRHIFGLRACDYTGPAHPQIKEVMIPLLEEIQADPHYAGLFDDLVAAK